MEYFLSAVSMLNPQLVLLIMVGVVVGLVFGALPGLSTTMAVALFLPVTFAMNMEPSFALLMGLYIGGISGGLVSAILINVPGTAASMMTCLDGHPMAAKGQAGKALGLGIVLNTKTGLGVAAINSLPYALSEMTAFTLGTWTTIV